MPIPSISGCTRFAIFVDDCTQVTWIYLLQSKAKVSEVVLHFCEMIATQFRVVIKRFHSDNAKEFFFNSIVDLYLIKMGVIHESSFVNTCQQNGLA